MIERRAYGDRRHYLVFSQRTRLPDANPKISSVSRACEEILGDELTFDQINLPLARSLTVTTSLPSR